MPVPAVFAVGTASFLLLAPTWWNNLAGYYVGTSISATALYIAYALPVILRLRKGSSFERGAWSLGRHHRWINVIAIAWVAFIAIILMLPTTPAGMPWRSEFDLNFVNYAPITIGAAVLLFGGWYVLCPTVVHGPGADGHDRGARAVRGRASRTVCTPRRHGLRDRIVRTDCVG